MNLLNKNICRTCKFEASNSKNFYNIFKRNKEISTAPKNVINKFLALDFRIFESDDMPEKICTHCLNTFVSFNEFIEKCKQIQLDFRNKLLQVKEENLKIELDKEETEFEMVEYNDVGDNKICKYDNEIKELFIEKINPSDLSNEFCLSNGESNSSDYDKESDSENYNVETIKEVQIEIENAYKLPTDLECRHCTDEITIFQNKKQLLVHLTTVHKEVVQKTKSTEVTICDICGLEMRQFRLRNHMQVVHEGKMPYKCVHCSDTFPYKINLTNHIKLAHRKQYLLDQQYKNKQIFECEYCKQIFKNLIALQGHINKMHDPNHPRNLNPRNKPFPCTECDRVYNRKDHLKAHIKKIHWKIMPFKCEKCKKQFSEQYELNQHSKKNHKEFESLKCDFCGKIFKGGYANLTYMKRHQKEQHSDLPQYNCLFCDMKFFKKSELNKHGKEHIELPNKAEDYYTSVEFLLSQ